ncbi:UNVERIFIED_CONTAM: hypothetical protein NCL1_57483 [Trichonephila clavipes]
MFIAGNKAQYSKCGDTQAISFGEVMDLLEETQAELKELKATLQKKEFIPENIGDDGKLKALTSFTSEEFFEWYKFLKIEKPLSLGSKRRPIDRFNSVKGFQLRHRDQHVIDTLYEEEKILNLSALAVATAT